MVVRSRAAVVLARRQADEIDGLARLFARRFGPAIAQEGAGHYVVEHGHAAEWLRDLEGARKPEGADLMRAQADDLLAESGNRTGIGPVKTHDEIERGCLAGAVRADQAPAFRFRAR